MEVVGSAVGIASLGIQVCQGLVQFFEAWRAYTGDMQQIGDTVRALGEIFKALEIILNDAQVEPALQSIANDRLQACFESVRILEKEAAALQSRKGFQAQLLRSLYPIKKETLQGVCNLVDRLTNQLQLALSLIRFEESRRMHARSFDLLTQIKGDTTTTLVASRHDTLCTMVLPSNDASDHLITSTTYHGGGTTFHCDDRLSGPQIAQLSCFMSAMGLRSIRITPDISMHNRLPAGWAAMLGWLSPRESQNLSKHYNTLEIAKRAPDAWKRYARKMIPGGIFRTVVWCGLASESVVAAAMIDHLTKAVHCADSPVVFVYCQPGHAVGAAQLLGSLLRQVVESQDCMSPAMHRLLERRSLGGVAPSTVELEDTLLAIARSLKTLTIVTIAFDECEGRSRYLSGICRLQEECNVRHLVFASDGPKVSEDFYSPGKFCNARNKICEIRFIDSPD